MSKPTKLKAELEKLKRNKELAMAGHWEKPKMDIAKELWQEIRNIKDIEDEIENLRHPEDKLIDAENNYNTVLAEMSDNIAKAEAEIREIQKTLTKSWEDYADKKRGQTVVGKINPQANKCYLLSKEIESHRWQISAARDELFERRRILENFTDLITDAEKRLDIARNNAKNCEYLINRRIAELEQKIKDAGDTEEQPEQKKPQIHTIRYYMDRQYDAYVINKDDVIQVANNGARGISFAKDGKYLVSIPKSYLKPIVKEIKDMVCDIYYKPDDGYLEIKWQNGWEYWQVGRYRFYCKTAPHPYADTVFEEALCNVQDKPIKMRTNNTTRADNVLMAMGL